MAYLSPGERELLRATLHAIKKKKWTLAAEGCEVTIEDIGMVIDAVHSCGYFFIKKGTVAQFDKYCEKVHSVLKRGLIGADKTD